MRLCVRLAAFCAFIALLQSQALWFDDNRLILPVPVLDIFGGAMPVLIARFFYYSVLGATAVLFVRPDLRYLCFYPPAVFLFWVLRDALRLQPQLYMFMFTLLAAGAMPAKIDNRALDPLRLMAIGSYFWAGFYKINIHFVQDIFPWFVGTWLQNPVALLALGIAAPLFEIGIALFLVFPRTRRIGVLMATVMLIVVLAGIGPLGRNWNSSVWPWNIFLEAMVVALFWRDREKISFLKTNMARTALALFVILPALGMADGWGAYPSFKLYCGCTPQVYVHFSPREDLSFLPGLAQEHLNSDHDVNMLYITYGDFGVGEMSALTGTRPRLHELSGLCAHLADPHAARVIVRDAAFWQQEFQSQSYNLCPSP